MSQNSNAWLQSIHTIYHIIQATKHNATYSTTITQVIISIYTSMIIYTIVYTIPQRATHVQANHIIARWYTHIDILITIYHVALYYYMWLSILLAYSAWSRTDCMPVASVASLLMHVWHIIAWFQTVISCHDWHTYPYKRVNALLWAFMALMAYS